MSEAGIESQGRAFDGYMVYIELQYNLKQHYLVFIHKGPAIVNSCKLFLFFLSLALIPLSVNADWKDFVSSLKNTIKEETDQKKAPILPEKTIVAGLKEALNKGIEKSVKQLGRKNGFMGDTSVKIPMPKTLKDIDKGLRAVGQDKVADKFILTMNNAAERAVSKTTGILVHAVKKMSLKDAVNILNGKDDAATQYFRKTQSENIKAAIKPVVQKAVDSVGLTEKYKKMIEKAGFLAQFFDKDSLDIDQYITRKAVDGIFIKIALEEKRIRKDPLARTTDLLKSVFG